MLTSDVKKAIDRCVLCWLATVDAQGQPNVSPKELFTYYGEQELVIAQIASPQSVRNIQQQSLVCVSLVDVFVQKGYKLKGRATLLTAKDSNFAAKAAPLQAMAGDTFPFGQIICIQVTAVAPIVAPRYQLYPDTREEDQIQSAMRSYGVRPQTD